MESDCIIKGISGSVVLELMVENLGRANFGVPHTFDQRKGIWQGDILIDDQGSTTEKDQKKR